MEDTPDKVALLNGSGQVSTETDSELVANVEKQESIVQQEEEAKQIPFVKFFSYLDYRDKFLLVFGTLAAILAGGILPSISLVMGNVAAAFSGHDDPSDSNESILQTMTVIAAIVSLIALSLFVFAYMFYAFW
jgi:hypothetical protein